MLEEAVEEILAWARHWNWALPGGSRAPHGRAGILHREGSGATLPISELESLWLTGDVRVLVDSSCFAAPGRLLLLLLVMWYLSCYGFKTLGLWALRRLGWWQFMYAWPKFRPPTSAHVTPTHPHLPNPNPLSQPPPPHHSPISEQKVPQCVNAHLIHHTPRLLN